MDGAADKPLILIPASLGELSNLRSEANLMEGTSPPQPSPPHAAGKSPKIISL